MPGSTSGRMPDATISPSSRSSKCEGARKCGVRNSECGLRSAECGVRSAECGVRSAECGVRSAECGVRSAECGVRSAECGVRSAECGVRSFSSRGPAFAPAFARKLRPGRRSPHGRSAECGVRSAEFVRLRRRGDRGRPRGGTAVQGLGLALGRFRFLRHARIN